MATYSAHVRGIRGGGDWPDEAVLILHWADGTTTNHKIPWGAVKDIRPALLRWFYDSPHISKQPPVSITLDWQRKKRIFEVTADGNGGYTKTETVPYPH
jgi:hypothetical protein